MIATAQKGRQGTVLCLLLEAKGDTEPSPVSHKKRFLPDMNDSLLLSGHPSSDPSIRDQAVRHMEEISLNAWPSHKIELYDGWLIRYSCNYTYRTNAVEQVGPSTIPVPEKVAYCEQVYREYHTPCHFKIHPLLDPDFDRYLSEQDYEIRHVTEVMTADLKRMNLLTPTSSEYDFENRLGIPSCIHRGTGRSDGCLRSGHLRPGLYRDLRDLCLSGLPPAPLRPGRLQRAAFRRRSPGRPACLPAGRQGESECEESVSVAWLRQLLYVLVPEQGVQLKTALAYASVSARSQLHRAEAPQGRTSGSCFVPEATGRPISPLSILPPRPRCSSVSI